MKNAFTMIELIFVIVIIGILSAIAIPKMMATKDDAKVVKEIANAKQVIKNAGSQYIATDSFGSFSDTDCFGFTTSDSNFTVSLINENDSLCKQLKAFPKIDEIVGTYEFGGTKVQW